MLFLHFLSAPTCVCLTWIMSLGCVSEVLWAADQKQLHLDIIVGTVASGDHYVVEKSLQY